MTPKKYSKKERLTTEMIETMLKATAGNVSLAAEKLGVSRMTLYRKINASERLQITLDAEREKLVDMAETALRALILEKNVAAIIFTLKTQGKKRGYIERQEIEQSGEVITRVYRGVSLEDL